MIRCTGIKRLFCNHELFVDAIEIRSLELVSSRLVVPCGTVTGDSVASSEAKNVISMREFWPHARFQV